MSPWLFDQGHAGAVHGVSFSPDGARFVTASEHAEDVRIWDASGALVEVLDTFASAAVFAGDGLVLRRGYRGLVRLDADRRETYRLDEVDRRIAGLDSGAVLALNPGELLRITAAGAVEARVALDFYPDFLTARRDGSAAAWSSEAVVLADASLAVRALKTGSKIEAVALHPERPRVAVVDDVIEASRLYVFDGGAEVASLDLHALMSGWHGIVGAIFLSERRLALFTSAKDKPLWVVDLEKHSCENHAFTQANAWARSPDGTRLAVGTHSGDVSLWSLEGPLDGKAPALLRTTAGTDAMSALGARPAPAAVYSARGAMIEAWDQDGLSGYGPGGTAAYVLAPRPGPGEVMIGGESTTALLKEPSDKKSVKFKGQTRLNRTVAFDPSGERVALGRCTFDMTGKVVKKAAVDPLVASFSDGKRLLTAAPDAPLRIVDWSGKQVAEVPIAGRNGEVHSVATAPTGEAFACGVELADRERGVLVWTRPGAEPHGLEDVRSHASVAFSPDGARVAAADARGVLRIFDVASGKPTHAFTGLESANVLVAFVSRSVVALRARGSELRLWDFEKGRSLALHATSAKDWVALCSDGRFQSGGKKLVAMISRVGKDGRREGPGAPTPGLLGEWLT